MASAVTFQDVGERELYVVIVKALQQSGVPTRIPLDIEAFASHHAEIVPLSGTQMRVSLHQLGLNLSEGDVQKYTPAYYIPAGVMNNARPQIMILDRLSPWDRRFNVAHEIVHHFLLLFGVDKASNDGSGVIEPRLSTPGNMYVKGARRRYEGLANKLARALLMPPDSFIPDIRTLDLSRLALKYSVPPVHVVDYAISLRLCPAVRLVCNYYYERNGQFHNKSLVVSSTYANLRLVKLGRMFRSLPQGFTDLLSKWAASDSPSAYRFRIDGKEIALVVYNYRLDAKLLVLVAEEKAIISASIQKGVFQPAF